MQLFYRELGRGESLIILHGLFGMSDNWLSIARRLAERYHVFLPDQRNHGRSAHSPDLNYQVLRQDLCEFVEQRQLNRVNLIGHSMGGKVAMRYAMDCPEKLNRLVVIDIAPRSYVRPYLVEIVSALQELDPAALQTRSQADRLLAQKISNGSVRQFLLKNLFRDDSSRFGWRINVRAIAENMDQLLAWEETGRTFDGPVLFIRGGKSDYISDDDSRLIKRSFPVARLETLDEATHWVHADAPDQLCETLQKFFQSK